MSLPAVFDKVNNILIILPDNAELTSEIGSADIARAKKIINLRKVKQNEGKHALWRLEIVMMILTDARDSERFAYFDHIIDTIDLEFERQES